MPQRVKLNLGQAATPKSKAARITKSKAAKNTPTVNSGKAVVKVELNAKNEAQKSGPQAISNTGKSSEGINAEECDPIWQKSSDKPLKEQVRISTQAHTYGLIFLRDVKKKLVDHSYSHPILAETESWEDEIDEFLKEKETAPTLIGFVGATGAGKSSLINALLGYEGLLPSSSSTSCTSTITKLLFLRDTDSEIKFRAEIEFIDLSEFQKDLDKFFEDVQAKNNSLAANEPDEEDEPAMDMAECNARIDVALLRLAAVYPQMSKDDIKSSSTIELLSDETVQEILTRGSVTFEDAELKPFARKLKPYVDSSLRRMPGSRSLYVWPLVRLVNIYTKSPMHDRGHIVYIDIPGSENDSNAARAAVAEKFKEQLQVTCIVVPQRRAITDKSASVLLFNKHEELRLMMDGQYKASRLCCVVSQIDIMPLDEYQRENPNIQEEMADQISKEQDLARQLRAYEMQYASKEKRSLSSGESNAPSQKRQRTNIEGDSVRVNSSTPYIDLPGKMAQLRENIRITTSARKQMCIKQRSQSTRLGMVKEFIEHRQQLLVKSKREHSILSPEESLNVFCTSASIFHELRTVHKDLLPYEGFASKEETGIPELRAFCREASYGPRRDDLQRFLIKLDAFKGKLQLWGSFKGGEKIPVEKKEEVQTVAKNEFERMRKIRSELSKKMFDYTNNNIIQEMAEALPQATNKAKRESGSIVRGWQFYKGIEGNLISLRWNTFKAIAVHEGVWRSYTLKKNFNWIETLADSMIDGLKGDWDQIWERRFPIVQDFLIREITRSFQDFIVAFKNSIIATCNSLQVPILMLEQNWKRLLTELLSSVEEGLKDYRAAAKSAWRYVQRTVKKYILPILEESANQAGRGSFKRSKAIMEDSVKQCRERIFREGGEEVIEALRQTLRNTISEIRGHLTKFTTQFKGQFSTTLEQNSSTQGSNEGRGGLRKVAAFSARLGMAELQEVIRREIAYLDAKWQSVEDVKEEEENQAFLDGYDYEEPLPVIDGDGSRAMKDDPDFMDIGSP